MMSLAAFGALFISIFLMQISTGALGPMAAIAGGEFGFSTSEIGLFGSAHFVGFFVGCFLTPRLMQSVGHSRTFAFVAACGAISVVLHPVFTDPIAWSIFRLGSGIAVAGAYTVVESWLQASVENETRGRFFGVYRTVDMSGSIMAQFMIAVLDPTGFVAYNILAVFAIACLIPLAMTKRKPPKMVGIPKLQPLKVFRISPLAGFAIIVGGLTNSSFRMIGPVIAVEYGLQSTQIAFFLALAVIGGAAAQPIAGWIADKYDRRYVLVSLSILAIVICYCFATFASLGVDYLLPLSAAFGMIIFPMYSVAAAHANDFGSKADVVALNASIIFMFGVGAIISPYTTGWLISLYGPDALFYYISVAHGLLLLFTIYRATVRPSEKIRTPYQYIPRTSAIVGNWIRKKS